MISKILEFLFIAFLMFCFYAFGFMFLAIGDLINI